MQYGTSRPTTGANEQKFNGVANSTPLKETEAVPIKDKESDPTAVSDAIQENADASATEGIPLHPKKSATQ